MVESNKTEHDLKLIHA